MTPSLTHIHRPTSRQLLARILDEPNLTAQIHALPPPALAKLIDRIGLEDAGEIVAFTTTEQLAQVFDEDLWRSDRSGEDERFDSGRFLLWLEVMLEAGDAFVAQKLADLPPDLVTLAFHRHVLVLDFEAQMSELGGREAAAAEKALSDCLSDEIDEFLIVARRPDGWDSLLAALVALDRDHHDLLVRILERCCQMSTSDIDDAGGLYEVLTSEQMLENDVAADREDRRAEAGFVAPSSAAAFLKLARTAPTSGIPERDPLTRAWFRNLAKPSTATPAASRTARGTTPHAPHLLALLREAGVVETTAPPLLPAPTSASSQTHASSAEEPLLIRAMRRLAEEDPDTFAARSEELAYLANVLIAGCSFEGRRMRPIEATRTAIDTTSLGLELSIRPRTKDPLAAAIRLLREHTADTLFRVGWASRPLRGVMDRC